MLLGDFLKKHMDEKNMSFAELSRRSGVPASTIRSMVIRNNERVSVNALIDICKVLECDINEYVDSLDMSKYVVETAEQEQTKKIVPIETYKDEIFEQLNKLSYDELVELQQYLKFLQFKRDHPDEL